MRKGCPTYVGGGGGGGGATKKARYTQVDEYISASDNHEELIKRNTPNKSKRHWYKHVCVRLAGAVYIEFCPGHTEMRRIPKGMSTTTLGQHNAISSEPSIAIALMPLLCSRSTDDGKRTSTILKFRHTPPHLPKT